MDLYKYFDVTKWNIWDISLCIVSVILLCVLMTFVSYFILIALNSDFEEWRKHR